MQRVYEHIPVLIEETLEHLQLRSGDHCIDCTVGGGGHARAMLTRTSPSGVLLGIDIDPQAVAASGAELRSFGQRATIVQANYRDIKRIVAQQPFILPVNAIVLDLGLSTDQLNQERGFSFHDSGALGMRFDGDGGRTASEILLYASVQELARIFRTYGELPSAHALAKAIVASRADITEHGGTKPVVSVPKFVKLIERIVRSRRKTLHPATLVFQALRIAVNDELENLSAFLPEAVGVLATGGRIAVISYHSLEDRIVKSFFKRESRDCICPPRTPVCRCGHMATVKVVTTHAIKSSEKEQSVNPRARSALLRVAEKI
ncbi:MAG: 16S rRNA (cytosine(1402)-N(4))-methyltransferase [Candidatus Komeilibacteria bacterium RIFCSPLOWO2_01_FULL_52_15]|uniref:Ribosomal RNA small subunit methyltransferase H n=1 Tax=Candidatus Komeilibacteria bacterium RIFCSPLOWO2_01_FULL_52_15 TaxID=1798551 RepID=A0A1G2BQI4_9BACT|nr:MAG: 16S rRNA (cytosine(1402)-N(4))-methyltransferase [Candidatus Komeilibacteria bacterium RIFCSPLOWO2_01_FULL_52_15]